MIFEPSVGLSFAAATLALGLRLVGQHDASTPWDRRIGGIAWVGMGAWAWMQWATVLVPVVHDVSSPLIARGDGWAIFEVAAVKGREDCEFEYAQARVVLANGTSDNAFWERLSDPAPGQSRMGGPQTMGTWRIKFSEEKSPKAVMYVSHHDCGPLWGRTTTESGPFPLEP